MAEGAIGFRVKTGRAVAVLLSEPAASPKVIDRREVQLSDPAVPASCHAFHAALELAPEAAQREVARLSEIVERFASQSLSDLLDRYRADGHRLRRAGIVVGSLADPAAIGNAHIRAHAAEGRLYRVQVERAAARGGLESIVIPEREILARASAALGRPPEQIKKEVAALGKGLQGPWRSEEKQAALAAWLALA